MEAPMQHDMPMHPWDVPVELQEELQVLHRIAGMEFALDQDESEVETSSDEDDDDPAFVIHQPAVQWFPLAQEPNHDNHELQGQHQIEHAPHIDDGVNQPPLQPETENNAVENQQLDADEALGLQEMDDDIQGEGHAEDVEDPDSDIIDLSEDEDDRELITTSEQVAEGKDMQGIPWDQLQFSRQHYRQTRIKQYRNYVNILPEDADKYRPDVLKKCQEVECGSNFYTFDNNNRHVNTSIVHFQLRNLIWAVTRNDVFMVCQNSINHWNPATKRETEVINLSNGGKPHTRPPSVGKVQTSTLCVKEGVLAAGGFAGELIVKRLGQPGWVYSGRVSASENAITNGLEIFTSHEHGTCLMSANNDSLVRVYSLEPWRLLTKWEFTWAVNFVSMQPVSGCSHTSGSLAAVVGDDPVTWLQDIRHNKNVAKLVAHDDFSFAVAWHPNGLMLATGNQDTTTAVWDIRKTDAPVARLAGQMGAIRSLRWTPDGRFLAAAEPADFVHLYDSASGFKQAQMIDVFGEISGISFTPAGDSLYVGIADITYGSLLSFRRSRRTGVFNMSTASTGAAADMVPAHVYADPSIAPRNMHA